MLSVKQGGIKYHFFIFWYEATWDWTLVSQTIGKQWVECLLMVWETRVQSQVESYQRLEKWYLMPCCLTLSIIRYVSRVNWSNPGKEVAPFPTHWCSSYWKGRLGGHPRLKGGNFPFFIVIHDFVYVKNRVNIMLRRCNNCLYLQCHTFFFMCVSVYGDDFN